MGLNRDVCHRCYAAAAEISDSFRVAFNGRWSDGVVWCPVWVPTSKSGSFMTRPVATVSAERPPEWCLYAVEHAVSQ